MALSYVRITPGLACRTRLVMTDVDGTLTSADDTIGAPVLQAVHALEESGIRVGLISGRTLPGLESLARRLQTSGPIIAENGAVAMMRPGGQPIDFGYSRRPALDALERLKALFPGAITEREDNARRLVDVVLWSDGVDTDILRQHLGDVQLVDSGYIMHLMPAGISKGATLVRLLGSIGDGPLSPEEVMVFGDSATDASLFDLFPFSVLVPNPGLPPALTRDVRRTARYVAGAPLGEGFVQVARHIVEARARPPHD